MNLKKLLSLFAAAPLLGALPAQAEVIENYTYGFDEPLDVTNEAFHPFGWLHSVDGSYSSSAVYTYHEEGGRSNGCLEGVQPTSYWSTYNDVLITPPVTGESSVYIKATDETGSVKFFSIGTKSTYQDNNWNVTDMNVTVPALTVGEWVKVDIPAVDNARIGIRLDHACMDDFTAASADVTAYEELKIKDAKLTSDYNVAGNPDNTFDVTYTLTLQNNGELTYNPGDEGYTLSHYIYISGDTKFIENSVCDIDIPEAIAPGETKEMVINATFTVTSEAFKANNFKVFENKTNSSYLVGTLTYTPYVPEIQLFNPATDTKLANVNTAWNAPYTPGLNFGCIFKEDMRVINTTIKNIAPKAPVTITEISVPENFEVEFNGPVTLAAGESAPVTVRFTGTAPAIYRGELLVKSEELDDMKAYLSAAIADENVWHEGFEESKIPAGYLTTDTWMFKEMPEAYAAEGHNVTLSSDYSSYSLITPKLKVEEGEKLIISGYEYEYGPAELRVAYSADRNEWTEVYERQASTTPVYNRFITDKSAAGKAMMSFIEIDAIPAGEWFVKFYGTRFNIDEVYGYHATEFGKDLYIKETVIPHSGKVNNALEANATIINLGLPMSADEYTATLYIGENAVAKAESVDIEAGAELTFHFNGVPHESGNLEGRIEFKVGEATFTSPVTAMEIAAETHSETSIIGDQSGSADSGPVYKGRNKLIESFYSNEYLKKYNPNIKAGDKISSISYFGTYKSYYNAVDPFTVHLCAYVRNTEATMLEESPNSGWYKYYIYSDSTQMVKVFEGDITINEEKDGGKLFTLDFDEPFVYDGTNLDIMVASYMEESYYSESVSYWATYEYGNIRSVYNESTPFGEGRESNHLPTIGINIVNDVATVSGTVTHSLTGEPIADVNIKVEAEGDVFYTTTTDAAGQYSLEIFQPARQYKVKATKENHVAYESPEYLDLSELNAVHDFEMSDLSDGIDSAMADSRLKVTAGTGYIALSADETVSVTVADLAGRTVASLPAFTGETRIGLPAGIYIVNKTKVAVK